MIPIQATISGYLGASCTLFSAYDDELGILTIAALADMKRDRRKDCVVITNVHKIERDVWFEESDLSEAVRAYSRLLLDSPFVGSSTASRLHFSEKVQRVNPVGQIEHDGMDERGQKFRIGSELANAHIAVLATCLYVQRTLGKPEATMDAASELLTAMLQGRSLTYARDRFNGQLVKPAQELEGFVVEHDTAERIKRQWGMS